MCFFISKKAKRLSDFIAGISAPVTSMQSAFHHKLLLAITEKSNITGLFHSSFLNLRFILFLMRYSSKSKNVFSLKISSTGLRLLRTEC